MPSKQIVKPSAPIHSGSSSSTYRSAQHQGVLLTAAELYATRSRHDLEEKRIFLELLRNLLDSTPEKDRRKISHLMSVHPEMPQDILERLAADADDLTAYPALRYSASLSVDLLVKTVQSGPEQLRKAIAQRPSLRDSVLSALCAHAAPDTIGLLLARDDVKLARHHRSLLGNRPEIVNDIGEDLNDGGLLHEEGLLSQYLHLPKALKAEAIAAAELASVVNAAQSPVTARPKPIDTTKLRLHGALHQAALNGRQNRFTETLSQTLGLSQSICDYLLQGDQGEGLVIALKALGMEPVKSANILIRFFGHNTGLEKIRDLLRLHKSLSSGAANVLVGQWMLNSELANKVDAAKHAPQFQEAQSRTQSQVRTDRKTIVSKSGRNRLAS